MTTFTRDWDAAYEALPTDDNYMYEVDNFIRQVLVDIRERIVVDHIWKVGSTDGEHKQITLSAALGVKPTAVAGKIFIYSKDVSGKAEAFIEDEDGDEVQLTKAGASMSFPAGTKCIFYQDTAPIGWTIANTLDDKLLIITKGSVAGGEPGGGIHSAGTWTIPTAHTHTIPTTSHTHTIPRDGWGSAESGYLAGRLIVTGGSGTYSSQNDNVSSATGGTDITGSGLPNITTWRPAAYCAIIATKD